MKHTVGTITIDINVELLEDEEGDVTMVDGPPTLAVDLDLPYPIEDQVGLAIKYMRKIADQLEAGMVAEER